MKKKLISIFISGILIVSSLTYAETYEKTEYFSTLKKNIITIDEVKNIETLKKDNLKDLVSLGDFYLYNKKYKNTFKSYRSYESAAIRGSEYSKMMVGYLTYKGYGVEPNVYKGENLLRQIKKPFNKNAEFLLALSFYEDSLYNQSIDLFKNIKDPVSYTYLSDMLVMEKRSSEAVLYLQWLIDEENDNAAKRKLGLIYLSKELLDEPKAIKLLKESAEHGDDISQYTLGLYYYQGTKEQPSDIKESVRWLTIAAQHNNEFAIQELLKIWSDNQSNNNLYGLNNDPYLTKILNDIFTKNNLN